MSFPFFQSRDVLLEPSQFDCDAEPGMALWRERLFIFLSRNSQRASSFFHIPAEQVVEIGVVVEI